MGFRNVRSSLRSTTARGFVHLPFVLDILQHHCSAASHLRFVLDILQHGSRSAEEAISKAEAWNLVFRSSELLFLCFEWERLVPKKRIWSRQSLILVNTCRWDLQQLGKHVEFFSFYLFARSKLLLREGCDNGFRRIT